MTGTTAVSLADGIARICHEANRAYCLMLGDTSQPRWEDAPEWQRESAIAGVFHHLDGAITSPEESHQSWMAHKLDAGWVYGPVKDPAAKTHPCLVPYSELPEEQRMKDAIFTAIVAVFKKAH